MLNIILIGPPAVGKGSIAKRLHSEYNITHISTGDILRSEMSKKTDLGLSIKNLMDNGKYVPDDLITQVVETIINQDKLKNEGFILDGFPRTLNQANFLYNWLKENSRERHFIFQLNASYETLLNRMKTRNSELKRSDDVEEIFETRYKLYCKEIQNVLAFYAGLGILIPVDGSLDKNSVYENITGHLTAISNTLF